MQLSTRDPWTQSEVFVEPGVRRSADAVIPRPLVVAPYVLGGMLLGHLIAPC